MAGEDIERLVREAGDRVREVVTQAERRAEEIVEAAKAEAERIRGRAEAEARQRVDQARRALDELESRLGGAAEVNPEPVTVPEPTPPAEPMPQPSPETVPQPPAIPEPMPEPMPEPTPPPDEADRPAAGVADLTAVRLVAMKLALDGTPRDEAREQLEAEYRVADLDGLLADVYAKAAR